jgi:hypothetical protein
MSEGLDGGEAGGTISADKLPNEVMGICRDVVPARLVKEQPPL